MLKLSLRKFEDVYLHAIFHFYFVVVKEGKLALLGANSRFLCVNTDEEIVICESQRAGKAEMINVR